MSKIRPDCWNSNPSRVTSYLALVPSTSLSLTDPELSPVCGFGWQFEFTRKSSFAPSKNNANVQERKVEIIVTFKPHLCQGMTSLGNLSINIDMRFPGKDITFQEVKESVSITSERVLGTFVEPFDYAGQPICEITLGFNLKDQLSFPTTPSSTINDMLAETLDGKVPIDTKFYLYSSLSGGKPGRPRPVFGNADLLSKAGIFFQDLLSESGFQEGIHELYEDPPSVIGTLKPETYDYDSDSDLEHESEMEKDEPGATIAHGFHDQLLIHDSKEPDRMTPGTGESIEKKDGPSQGSSFTPSKKLEIRAYAINGTAYQTWKALVFYVYTNQVFFKPLHSNTEKFASDVPKKIEISKPSCSPKSMYRLADYVGLPTLKSIALKRIKEELSNTNIIPELFSEFTSRYQELIEMEVDFLIAHIKHPRVARDFDDALQLMMLGTKPYCHRILAFAIRRFRGETAATAWLALETVQPELSGSESADNKDLFVSEGVPPSPKPKSIESSPITPASAFGTPAGLGQQTSFSPFSTSSTALSSTSNDEKVVLRRSRKLRF